MENGLGGRIIDPAACVPHETTSGPSFWGHDRLYLSEEDRSNFRDMRLKVAQEGTAHLTPPFIGQGICAGVRDAANLAWKLALCVKNEVGDKIIQSYAQERILHVKVYISTAVCLGELIYSADPVSALTANFGQDLGYAKMKSISPLLGVADFFRPSRTLLKQRVSF